jgi:hypothetical protein
VLNGRVGAQSGPDRASSQRSASAGIESLASSGGGLACDFGSSAPPVSASSKLVPGAECRDRFASAGDKVRTSDGGRAPHAPFSSGPRRTRSQAPAAIDGRAQSSVREFSARWNVLDCMARKRLHPARHRRARTSLPTPQRSSRPEGEYSFIRSGGLSPPEPPISSHRFDVGSRRLETDAQTKQ